MPPAGLPIDTEPLTSTERGEAAADLQVMQLIAEHAVVSKRVRKTKVRVETTTRTRDQVVEADLNHDQVVVERAIGRVVDAVSDVRQEGNVTILPVVEEEVVVVRRLVLKRGFTSSGCELLSGRSRQ